MRLDAPEPLLLCMHSKVIYLAVVFSESLFEAAVQLANSVFSCGSWTACLSELAEIILYKGYMARFKDRRHPLES